MSKAKTIVVGLLLAVAVLGIGAPQVAGADFDGATFDCKGTVAVCYDENGNPCLAIQGSCTSGNSTRDAS